MNKTHWNSIILDGSVPDKDIRRMIGESYDLTKGKKKSNHVLYSDYSEVITVGAGADAVDFKLVSLCQKGDIVVTQDYGVAAMILGKGAYGIHQSGKWYTNENIDQMLMERHLAKKARNAKKRHHLKGPAKRTEEDDKRFEVSLERLIDYMTLQFTESLHDTNLE